MPNPTISLQLGLFTAAALPDGSAGDVWIKLMPAGTWTLRDGRGPFVSGDKARMQKIVDASRAYAGGTDPMIDYDHQSAFSAVPGVGGNAPAAGWIKEMEARDDGIYGRVAWTAAAADKIKAQEYRYISPLFQADKRTGQVQRLTNAGLVNAPALDLTAIAAALQPNPEEDDSMKSIAKALGLAEGASEEAILAAIGGNHAKITAAAGLKPEATVDQVVTSITAAVATRAKLAQAAGVKTDASDDDLVTAVAASAAGAGMVPKASFDQLAKDLNDLKSSISDGKADEAVTAAIKVGKIAPAQKDWATKRAKADLADFESFVASAPVLVATQLGETKPAGGANLSDPSAIAASARTYMAEQAKAGNTVTYVQAVNHVASKK